MAEAKPYGTVLIKAAKIMDYLSEHPNRSLQEIATSIGMTASTTIKILDTLVLIGYVQKNEDKSYRLGSKLIRYANKRLEQLDLAEITYPYLERLQQTIDETIHLGILNDNEILYINKLEPKHQTIRMSSKVGITRPLYSSAMGKAVLAKFSQPEFEAYLESHVLTPYTENTITNPLRLAKELDEIRQTCVAFDDEEMEMDIFCIGASLESENQIIGAFSVSMPKYRLNEKTKELIIQAVLKTKEELEQILMAK
ncbi:IclR family transcriptional regulator [Enterococcus sp. BWR-S5]|uniref:IclR family transcriptional regulator n=1 Tax=Enterococcus sp. BWR-S5 TaxID=2787714 RepID=UPI001924D858|nr:IclR family transcriptional regulator [Enterococcus sp. BWR-S5]MBL1225115.1 IclR family transcriptional regulator [Enterococcus sp. BWR-S5]